MLRINRYISSGQERCDRVIGETSREDDALLCDELGINTLSLIHVVTISCAYYDQVRIFRQRFGKVKQ